MFLTARYHLAVVSYDQTTGELTTRAYGNIKVGYMYMYMCMCMCGGTHHQGLWEHQGELHVHVQGTHCYDMRGLLHTCACAGFCQEILSGGHFSIREACTYIMHIIIIVIKSIDWSEKVSAG